MNVTLGKKPMGSVRTRSPKRRTTIGSVALIASVILGLTCVGPAMAAAGDLDLSFTPPSLNASPTAIVELSDGKYLIGGRFTDAGGISTMDYLMRLNSDGSLDTSFTPLSLTPDAGRGVVGSIAVLPDGKYLVGGSFTDAGGDASADYVVRVNSDGTRDTSFTPASLTPGAVNLSVVDAVIALPDGKYLISGTFTNAGGDANTAFVARLNSNGTRDSSFTPLSLNDQVRAIAALSDGKYLIGGTFTDAGGDANTDKLARLNSNGTRDSSFTPLSLNNPVLSIAALSDGKYLIGGLFTDAGGDVNTDRVARLNSDGSRDSSFTPLSLNNTVYPVVALSDGKYLIAGAFTDAGGDVNTDRVARLNSDGSRDSSFTPPGINSTVFAATALADGKYLISGSFTSRLARLLSGSVVTASSGTAQPTYFSFVLPDGRECTAISPQRVEVGTMVQLPSAEVPCQTMPGSTVAGWTIPTPIGFTGYGSALAPFPPGLFVRVVESQTFTLVPYEPILQIDYDSNIAQSDTCTPASVTQAGDAGRLAHAWVPREIFSMARTAAQAPCAPAGYRLTGWNTAGDGSGDTLTPGAPLPKAWEKAPANAHRLYAQWRSSR